MYIFPPIDLKYTKKADFFRLRRAPSHYDESHLGKKYKSRMAGQKYEFQI